MQVKITKGYTGKVNLSDVSHESITINYIGIKQMRDQ